MSKILIRIQLKSVPLELFTHKGLSYIASAVGRPLYMDQITANQQRLAFAKVYVQVGASTVIPSFIEVKMSNRSTVSIKVITPWLSQRCLHCNIFDHFDKYCTKKQNPAAKVWVPKKSELVETEEPKNVSDNEDKGGEMEEPKEISVLAKEETDEEVKDPLGEKGKVVSSVSD
ncbi:hypothetical protein DITRI_Ditri18aG0009800 [Diplodiscus trichospermus]